MKLLAAIGSILLVSLHARTGAAERLPTCAIAPTAQAEAALKSAALLPQLSETLLESGGCRPQELSHTEAELAAARDLGLDCALDDTDCMRKLAAMLRVKRIVGVAATDNGDSITLSMVMVGAQGGRQLAAVEGDIPVAGPERQSGLQALTAKLLMTSRGLGALHLQVSEPGALVMLDGKLLQPAALTAPIADLKHGPHEIVVQLAGYETLEQAVEVVPGETRTVTLQLERVAVAEATTTAAVVEPTEPEGAAQEPDTSPSTEVVGWSITGVGGTFAALGALSVVVLDSTLFYSDAGDYQTRSGMLLAEKAMAGVAAAGLIATGVGIGIALSDEEQ